MGVIGRATAAFMARSAGALHEGNAADPVG
ncbi:MAG: hypothetical protein QOI12_4887, partial [Alphaproteobacteria bacterium]|nr:hypothetical protein [Alphaproteobacteria bacterium]